MTRDEQSLRDDDSVEVLVGLRSLATQVKPRFMLPAVATAGFGTLLAPTVAPTVAGSHVLCVALALYIAHLRDEYVDAHVRGEEEPSVTRRLLSAATVTAVVGFILSLGALWLLTDALAAALTLPLLAFALLHAPYLDTNPITVSADYPLAIGLVICGGYAAQTGMVPEWLIWVAGAFVLVLVGATVALDRLDRAFDATIDKLTVPVVLGDRRAALLSAGLVAAGGALVVIGVGAGTLPAPTLVAAVVPMLAAVASYRAPPRRAVAIQMAAAYPFASMLFLTICPGVDCVILDGIGPLF